MSRRVVVDTDMGMADAVAEIEKLNEAYVKIGFQQGSKTHYQVKNGRQKHADLSMPQIAAANEYGTEKIPARSFMRTSFDENLSNIEKALNGEFDKVVLGKSTVKKSLNLIGLFMTSLIQKKIRDIHYPPNSPRTIARKGSSKPLIDFGQMIQSVRHEVVIK